MEEKKKENLYYIWLELGQKLLIRVFGQCRGSAAQQLLGLEHRNCLTGTVPHTARDNCTAPPIRRWGLMGISNQHTHDTRRHSIPPTMRKPKQSTHMWLRRLNATPKSIWKMPRITDIFILKELRKASLLLAIFQICEKQHLVRHQGKEKRRKTLPSS